MAGLFSTKKSIPHSPSAPSISFKAVVSDDLNFDDLSADSDPHLNFNNGGVSQSSSPPPPAKGSMCESYDDIRSRTEKSTDDSLTVQNRSLSCNVSASEKSHLVWNSSSIGSPGPKNHTLQSTKESAMKDSGNSKPPRLELADQRNVLDLEMDTSSKNVDNRKVLLFVFTISVLLISLPVPSFLSGFMVGVFITASCALVLFTAMFPYLNSKTTLTQSGAIESPKPFESSQDSILRHQGFLNECSSYDRSSHRLARLKTVYVKLDGTTIKLYRSNKSVPKKSSSGEVLSPESFLFSHMRVFELMGAQVSIVPADLSAKLTWSRKFPIELKLATDGFQCFTSSEDDYINEDLKPCSACTVYLFARTSRDKEEWFGRLAFATGSIDKFQKGFKRVFSSTAPLSVDTCVKLRGKAPVNHSVLVDNTQCKYDMQYDTFVARQLHILHQIQLETNTVSSPAVSKNADDPSGTTVSSLTHVEKGKQQWPLSGLNLLLARCLWDAMRQQSWISMVANKIQAKLAAIKVPYFIDAITLVGLDVGSSVPILLSAQECKADDRGVWCSVAFKYNGGFALTVDTRLDLHKLVEVETSRSGSIASAAAGGSSTALNDTYNHSINGTSDGSNSDGCSPTDKTRGYSFGDEATHVNGVNRNSSISSRGSSFTSSHFGDDVEDSGESSEDGAGDWLFTMDAPVQDVQGEDRIHSNGDDSMLRAGAGRRSSSGGASIAQSSRHAKVMTAFDRLAKSHTVKKLKEKQFVKNIINDISKTHLVLTVQVQFAKGSILVNIPPPPTDRLWWGFDEETEIKLDVSPKVGEKMIKINLICNLIGTKLTQEIRKVLFYPNLDDLPIPEIL